MESETWHVEEVIGFTLKPDVASAGVIYFSKTRCGCKAMWQDYFSRIVVPTIRHSNIGNNPLNADGTAMRNFFSTDGEDIIIARAYEEDIQKSFEDELIDYGRVGAGSTGIHNACDRQLTFREVRKAVFKCISHDSDVSNNMLQLNIKKCFANFKEAYKTVQFGSTLQEDYLKGLLILCYCFDKTMTRSMVIRGFTCCGQDCMPTELN